MGDTRSVVVTRDAWLGGERVPVARGGRGGRRRGGKGTARCIRCWPGSGGRRRIGAVVVIERDVGTCTCGLGSIDGGGELEAAEVVMGWVPGRGSRGRGAFWVRGWGERAEGGGRGGWLGGVGKGVDWGKEDALVEGSRRLLVEGGRIGRGLGVGAHPAEAVGVGVVHGQRRREVVDG